MRVFTASSCHLIILIDNVITAAPLVATAVVYIACRRRATSTQRSPSLCDILLSDSLSLSVSVSVSLSLSVYMCVRVHLYVCCNQKQLSELPNRLHTHTPTHTRTCTEAAGYSVMNVLCAYMYMML